MRTAGHTVLVAALVVAAVAVVPGGAMAADGLDVSADQTDDGTVDVTVTQNGSAVANATVTVESANNTTYAGTGTYETDENGTVGLAAPEENVTVDVTAAANDATASTTATLTVGEEDDENESGNETDAFGSRVSSYVGFLQANGNMSGHAVAQFVTANNPGADNRPDHVDPGPKDDESDEEDDESEDGDESDAEDGADTEDDGNGSDGAGNDGNGNGNGGGNGNNGNGNGNGSGNNGNGNGPP